MLIWAALTSLLAQPELGVAALEYCMFGPAAVSCVSGIVILDPLLYQL